jgi:hypothetical protein
VGLTTSPPSVSRLSIKCGSHDVSEPYGPSWSVTGITLYLSLQEQVLEGFGAFTAVFMKSPIFWDVTPCSPLNVNGLHNIISQKIRPFINI